MAKHRRHAVDVLLAGEQYKQLMQALQTHRPGDRTGLCLACGIGWPCTDVRLPLERLHPSSDAVNARPQVQGDG